MTRSSHAPDAAGAPFDAVLQRLATDLIGPAPGTGPLIATPSDVFLTGVLFPARALVDEEEQPEQPAEFAPETEGDPAPEPPRRNQRRPAAAGLSFATETVEDCALVQVVIRGARYDFPESAEGKQRVWTRKPAEVEIEMFDLDDDAVVDLSARATGFANMRLRCVTKRVREHTAVQRISTIVVYNDFPGDPPREISESRDSERLWLNKNAFFEFHMEVAPVSGTRFIARKRRDKDPAADLLWRRAQEYAVGHTCAARWRIASNADPAVTPDRIETAWLPATHIRDTSSKGDAVFRDAAAQLNAQQLSEIPDKALFDRLTALGDAYGLWIAGQEQRIKTEIPAINQEAAHGNLATCRQALKRMRAGVAMLRSDPQVLEAFRLANAAMALQQSWKSEEPLVWRPFQMGFMLIALESTATWGHADRGVMDLIWFPTGGGKTEAYLLLTAFTIFVRKIRRGVYGAGVAAIMRYTLRLLTLQQFERAAAMIFACDILWTDRLETVGGEPGPRISLGLWLGSAVTPNTGKEVQKFFDAPDKDQSDVADPRRLQKCPCCGGEIDWSLSGDRAEANCGGDEDCRIGALGALPIYTVDEAIYDTAPSLVIGTADKFAQIARNPKTEALFGHDSYDPPDLILQDELHLISGPLGSMAGLYEVAVDALCARNGNRPKIIGSTATIKRAEEQVRQLFDRATFQFPPPGLDAENSGFAVENPDRTRGRLYVGVSTTGHSKPHMMQAVGASLLQSAADPALTPKERDAAWTLLVYFGSLRELGGSVTQFASVVPETMAQIAMRRGGEAPRPVPRQIEITSRVESDKIKGVLEALETPESAENPVDVALATNMISVGVDVPRLGLMMVDGQPKTVSEYIQATSRVGRSGTPGLVIGLFNATRNRDRSRFETHQTWHQALYRDVEPTAATPFAPRARDRALHAPLVALALHRIASLHQNPGDAVDHLDELAVIQDLIIERIQALDPDEANDARRELAKLVEDWLERDALTCWWRDHETESFLISLEQAAQRRAGQRRKRRSWATPNSLRDVEATVNITLKGE